MHRAIETSALVGVNGSRPLLCSHPPCEFPRAHGLRARPDEESSVQTVAAEAGGILITGANGHLGRRLIQRLAASPGEARPVRAVVRSERAAQVLRELPMSGALREPRALPEPNGPDIAVLDYGDVGALSHAAEGCEFAVHLVGIIKESSNSRYETAHEATSEALARAAAGAGMRRIVHLNIVGSHPDSPNACLASKGRAERILLEGATPALILRVPMVLGPGDFASRALRAQARSRFVPLLRGGAGREQPIDADDVVSAILSGIERPNLDDVALDLAGPESLSRRELLERTAALWGMRPTVIPIPLRLELAVAFLLETLLPDPPLTRAMVGVLDHDDVVDAEKACEHLGIHLTPLDQTLRRCIGPEESDA
jgi:NADH dehydrogenase